MLLLAIPAEDGAICFSELRQADFGTWRPNILIGLTVVMIAVSFAWLGVHSLNEWETGAALYILGRE